jgi:hypothetical protein
MKSVSIGEQISGLGQSAKQNLSQSLVSAHTQARRERMSRHIDALLAERGGHLPIWLRAPRSGPEHFTGLSRAKLYELSGKGRIRSISIREPGQIRGVRLFELAPIIKLIEANADDSKAADNQ